MNSKEETLKNIKEYFKGNDSCFGKVPMKKVVWLILRVEELEKENETACYEALTIQALRMRKEVFEGGGISRDYFDAIYLNSLGPYERDLAKREEITLEE